MIADLVLLVTDLGLLTVVAGAFSASIVLFLLGMLRRAIRG